MPNHCENHTDISGPNADLHNLIGKMNNSDGELLLSNLMPRPEHEASNDYDWERTNWGTKWGDYDHFLDFGDWTEGDDGVDTLSFSYMTAWSPFSTAFWEKVSAMFPALTFATTYEEYGMCYAGAVLAKNGLVVEEYTETLPDYPSGDSSKYLDAYDKWLDEMTQLRDRLADTCAEKMSSFASPRT